jgi:single-strand DNA-binding protein
MNVVVLQGTLSKEPVERSLPSGDRLVNYEVTTRIEGRPAVSVPVSWLDPPAAALGFAVGEQVIVVGEVRRRFFRAQGATASRTEVAATRVVAAAHRKRVATAVGPAQQAVADLLAEPTAAAPA